MAVRARGGPSGRSGMGVVSLGMVYICCMCWGTVCTAGLLVSVGFLSPCVGRQDVFVRCIWRVGCAHE